MRILIDTNILFSALLYPESIPAKALLKATEKNAIILCDQNISEFKEILKRKAPKYIDAGETFLAELSFELIPAINKTKAEIRDAKDQPILNAAMVHDVDIIITGDKDFLSLEIDKPNCITAKKYLEKY